jgi:hypothetical protein
MRPVTVLTRVRTLLEQTPRRPWCPNCLASELATRRFDHVLAQVEGYPGFRRGHGQCERCGQRRIVVMYAPEAASPTAEF